MMKVGCRIHGTQWWRSSSQRSLHMESLLKLAHRSGTWSRNPSSEVNVRKSHRQRRQFQRHWGTATERQSWQWEWKTAIWGRVAYEEKYCVLNILQCDSLRGEVSIIHMNLLSTIFLKDDRQVFSVRHDNRAQLRRASVNNGAECAYFSEAQPASSHRHLFCQTKGEIRSIPASGPDGHTRHLLNCVTGLGAQWIRAGWEEKLDKIHGLALPKLIVNGGGRRTGNEASCSEKLSWNASASSQRGLHLPPFQVEGCLSSLLSSASYLQTLSDSVSHFHSPSPFLLCRAGGDAERGSSSFPDHLSRW